MPQPRVHPSHAARQAAYRRRREQARLAELHAKGLPPLPAIATMPGSARWSAAIARAVCLLETVMEEMADYFDARSEEWQEGERGEEHQGRLALVEAALDAARDLTW